MINLTRVLITHVDMRFGGVETQLLALLNGFDRSRYEVHLALGRRSGERLGDVPGDVTIHDLDCGKSHRVSIPFVYRVGAVARRIQPDICLSYHSWTNAETYAGARVSRCGAPTVGSFPGEIISGRMDPLRAPLLRRMAALCCVGEGVAHSVVDTYGLLPNIRIIPNCVDIPSVKMRSEDEVDHPWVNNRELPLLVTASRLIPEKGVDFLLRTLQHLRQPARLLVLGDGPERRRLELLSHSLGLADRVAFLGYEKNPYRYFSKCDLFVFGARRGEGLPTVLIEAAVCRLPIVTSRFVGVDDAVIDGVTGLIAPQGDTDLMSDLLERVLEQPGLRENLRREAYARATREFSQELYVKRYESLFEELSSGRH